jgi:hypothetical protein
LGCCAFVRLSDGADAVTIEEFITLIDADGLPAPGMAAVVAFEAEHGLALPQDYREFLAATPGGRLRSNVRFSLSGGPNGQEILSDVAGLQKEEYYSLAQRFAEAEADAIPLGLLSIMSDRGGNAIALVLRPERLGETVFLDHEVAEEGRAALEAAEAEDWCYAIPFARSFTDMIAGCRFEPLE